MIRQWVLASVTLLLAACAASPAAREPIREAFTQAFALERSGVPVGYLIRYEPLPTHADLDRSLPTGTIRILDPGFVDVGYITPRGDVRRFEAYGESVSLGHHELEEGLFVFFGEKGPVRMRSISLRPGTTVAAEKSSGEGASEEPTAEPEESAGETTEES